MLVFAKPPLPGQVKTRLAAAIGHERAAALYARMVTATVSLAVEALLAPVEVHVSSDAQHSLFVSLQRRHGIAVKRQTGADLGRRMDGALRGALRHSRFAVLIGTDCPVMSADYLARACRALESGRDAVIGPAEDGGYVLLGVRVTDARLFEDIPWSSDQVLSRTRTRLQALGYDYTELDTLWDLDRPQDLLRWQSGDGSAGRAPGPDFD